MRADHTPVGHLAGNGLLGALVAVPALAILALGFLLLGGYRPMIEMSDSMSPVLRAGDIVIVKRIPASGAHVGDVVSFNDPARHEVVTHRIRAVASTGANELSITTRGDANTGSERWQIAPQGQLGRYEFRIPKGGYVVRWMSTKLAELIILLSALTLGLGVLRRIWWRRDTPAPLPLSVPPPAATRHVPGDRLISWFEVEPIVGGWPVPGDGQAPRGRPDRASFPYGPSREADTQDAR